MTAARNNGTKTNTAGRRRNTANESRVRSTHIVAAISRFFEGRGPHLAAMVAYFALASFVPLIFLALAGLGLSGQVSASSALVSDLHHSSGAKPGQHKPYMTTESNHRGA